MSEIYVGQVGPHHKHTLDVVQGLSGVDLTTVTAAEFRVQKPGLTPGSSPRTQTWDASTSAITATRLTLTHVFAAGDLDVKGTYVIYARLTTPGGVVETKRYARLVRAEFDASP